jgi:hypothetical protein
MSIDNLILSRRHWNKNSRLVNSQTATEQCNLDSWSKIHVIGHFQFLLDGPDGPTGVHANESRRLPQHMSSTARRV